MHRRMMVFVVCVLWGSTGNVGPVFGMAVEVVGRDGNGDTLLKSGDIVTPMSLRSSVSAKAQQALAGQGVGAIFGSVVFPGARPIPVLAPLPLPAPQPTQVLTSLQQVPEPTQISYGLTYGGISGLRGTSPPPTQPQVTGNFTLDGTVGGANRLAKNLTARAVPMANPLPGTVGLFLTGLGAGLGALRFLRHRIRTGC